MSRFVLSAFADEISDDPGIQMDTLDMYGIKNIEIRSIYGKNISEYTIPEIKQIKKLLDARGFGISAIGSPIGKQKITDHFAPHLDLYRHTLEIAGVFGTRYIRTFSFFIPEGDDPHLYRDEVMSRWKDFIFHAENTDIILLHENEKHIYGDTPERCKDLIETMNSSHVKSTFDPANFIQCDIEPYPFAYSMLKKYIAYVHIKDARYFGHSVVPSGHGDGRIAEIIADLHQSGFSGFLSLEPHLGSFTGLAALEPGSVISGMPEGGPKQFAIAYRALKKILDITKVEVDKL